MFYRNPWFFVITGFAVSGLSVWINSVMIADLDVKRQTTTEEIDNLRRAQVSAHGDFFWGDLKIDFARLLFSSVHSLPKDTLEPIKIKLGESSKVSTILAVNARFKAIESLDKALSDGQSMKPCQISLNEAKDLASNFFAVEFGAAYDYKDFLELTQCQRNQWQELDNRLTVKMGKLVTERAGTERKVESLRSFAVFLQFLGLSLVLLKDVFSRSSPLPS